jgi:acetoacetyl-CoA synthetase
MNNPLWRPSEQRMHASQMWQFMRHINQQYQLNLQQYSELYQWSIQNPSQFWSSVWEFCDVIATHKWDQVLMNPTAMPGAKWFTGAKLNFAENLLRFNNDKTALVFRNEKSQRRTLTYSELNRSVAQLASALRKSGIKANDCVAAIMPNMPETVIAMLATTSIGAIWSSCSPEFGFQGIYDRFAQIAPKILIASDGDFYNGKNYSCLEKIAELEQHLPSLQKIVIIPYIDATPDLSHLNKADYYQDFIDTTATTIHFDHFDFDHPLAILYSSGTTGKPKCIVHGAGGVLLQHLKELKLHTDLTESDVFFYYTTCGWMMWNWLISGLTTGATLVLFDGSPFAPKRSILMDLIESEKITVFGTSAKYISAIEKENLEPKTTHDLSSLKTILSTGSPLLPVNFQYVYNKIKTDVCLSSISGGTDIVSCFALGNPLLPVYSGELQCRGLGLKVEVFDEYGQSVQQQKGELVCTAPFPVMPIYFYNDPTGENYRKAYFEKFPGIWAHGDYAEITEHEGVIIYGRSDAILNPSGVRIGTAEIYRQVESIDEVLESLVIGQDWNNDTRVVLFVILRDDLILTDEIRDKIKLTIRKNASPHHVPAKIIQVPEIPRTISGKIVELAVRDVVHGRTVKNLDALANPDALNYFKNIPELT